MSACLIESNDTLMIHLPTGPLHATDSFDLDELLPIERQMLLEEQQQTQERFAMSQCKSRKTKSVSFCQTANVECIDSCKEMSDKEKEDVWYTCQELKEMKAGARQLCREEHKGRLLDPDLDSTRGMDVYYPHRQRAVSKFLFHVVEAFYVECNGSEEHLAMLSERWSLPHRQLSVAVATKDFIEVYGPLPVVGITTLDSRSPMVVTPSKMANRAPPMPVRTRTFSSDMDRSL